MSARQHLNQALAINPDHAAAHEYKGPHRRDRCAADDAEALFHLERAIDLDPARVEAVAAIETLLVGRGELRRYERVLKRLLFRLRGRGNAAEAKAWARLARLYLDHLDDPQARRPPRRNARRIAPRDPDVLALVQRTEKPRVHAPSRSAPAGARRSTIRAPAPRSSRRTEASGHADAAFLAASTMVALGTADAQMAALYEAHRVRGVVVPAKPLGRDQWALLRHKRRQRRARRPDRARRARRARARADDARRQRARCEAADSTTSMCPASFARLRQRCAELLGVRRRAGLSRASSSARRSTSSPAIRR